MIYVNWIKQQYALLALSWAKIDMISVFGLFLKIFINEVFSSNLNLINCTGLFYTFRFGEGMCRVHTAQGKPGKRDFLKNQGNLEPW